MASGKESVVKVTNSEEKKKALDAAIAKLEKDFGKGAVMKLGESGAHVSVETVPTGCLSLDLALGLGGVPLASRFRSSHAIPCHQQTHWSPSH